MDIFKAFGIRKRRPTIRDQGAAASYPGMGFVTGYNAPGMGVEPGEDPATQLFQPGLGGEKSKWQQGAIADPNKGGTGERGFWQRTDKYAQSKGLADANTFDPTMPAGQQGTKKWDWRPSQEWASQVTSKDPAIRAKAKPGGGKYEGWTKTSESSVPGSGYKQTSWNKNAPTSKVPKQNTPNYGVGEIGN